MLEYDSGNINPGVDINQVLEKKLRTYAEFLATTLLLKDAFEAEDMDKVEELTMERENMIRLVNGLDHQVGQANRNNGGDKKRAIITGALNTIIQKIIAANNDCESIAAHKCSLARNELKTAPRKGKVMSGYVNKTRGIPKFLDVKT